MPGWPTRRTLLTAGLGLAALPLYALGVEPAVRLQVKTYAPRLPRWPADLPLTIAAIADLHVGEPYMSLRRIDQIVARTNALKPDLIVLLGDYAAGHRFVTRPVSMREFATAARRLSAPLGVFAILGNHDWWEDLGAQRRRGGPVIAGAALEAVGIRVLENDAVPLLKDGRRFWLLGLGDQLALPRRPPRGVDDLPSTLAKLTDDAPALLLAHEPDIFPDVPERVALTLAGHTHGGQVRLLGYSPVVPSRYGNRYAYGHIVEDGRHLVVSGGLGASILPVRLGVPPEIVLVRLGPAASGAPMLAPSTTQA